MVKTVVHHQMKNIRIFTIFIIIRISFIIICTYFDEIAEMEHVIFGKHLEFTFYRAIIDTIKLYQQQRYDCLHVKNFWHIIADKSC